MFASAYCTPCNGGAPRQGGIEDFWQALLGLQADERVLQDRSQGQPLLLMRHCRISPQGRGIGKAS